MSGAGWAGREARGRIVYVGPGLSGKTTNLATLAKHLPGGRLSEVATAGERTLLFDFLPLQVTAPAGIPLRLNLHTVPGQARYREARRMVLRNVGALVFVADSHPLRLQANRYALDDIRELLVELGRDPAAVPVVFQYNKRDAPDAVPLAELDRVLNPGGAAATASLATTGVGVFRTLSLAISLVRARVQARLERLPDGIATLLPIQDGSSLRPEHPHSHGARP